MLVTITDWESKQFRLMHEPTKVAKRQRVKIEQQNRILADQLFEMLESSKNERVWGREAARTDMGTPGRASPGDSDRNSPSALNQNPFY